MSNIGFIYKICNSVDDEVYVGSTKQTIHKRFQCHLSNTNREGLKNLTLYRKMESIGKDKFKVELLETVQFDDKYELFAREQFYMDELNPTLNMRPSPHPDSKHLYYMKNKDDILQWSKEYYQENKEHIIERVHRYEENNKEKISERGKKYREEHNEEIKARKSKKCVCDCGVEYTHDHKSRHLRTKRHLEHMKSKEPTIEAPEPEVII